MEMAEEYYPCNRDQYFINTLRPRQHYPHLADDIFKRIFSNENAWISLKNSLNVTPKVQINNIPALVQIMAWRRPMMLSLLTHICVTRPQWGKCDSISENVVYERMLRFKFMSDSYDIAVRWMPHNPVDDKSSVVQVMAWCRQTTCHYLRQCWSISKLPYGFVGPQWVKGLIIQLSQNHGGYPVNLNVRYGSHNMVDDEPGKKQLWLLRKHVACSGLFSHWYL